MMAEALLRGLAAIFRPRLLLTYWLLSLLLSFAVAAGYEATVFDATRQLPNPGELAAEPSAPWIDDFSTANGPTLAVLGRSAGAAVWLWMLSGTLLAGGLVRAFERQAAERREREGERWGLRIFFGDAGRYAFRMLRLLVITLLLAHGCDWLFNEALGTWHAEHLDVLESERFSVLTDWLREGLFVLAIFLIATWTDLARVQVVIERRGSVFGALVSAANALISRPVELFGLAVFFVAVEWVSMLVAAQVLGRIRTDSPTELGWWVLGSQVLILLRIGLGFSRVAAFTAVAEDLRADSEARFGPARARSV